MTITESIDAPAAGAIEGDASEPTGEPPRRRLDLGVFVGVAMALVGMGFGATRISDNSFLTHLATGREMFSDGTIGIVREDVFTWTSGGDSVIVQSWLASVLYGFVDELAGFHGLRLLTAALAAGLAALAWRLTTEQPSIVTRVAVMLPLLAIGFINWTERPLLIAFVLFAATMVVVEGDGRPRWLVLIGALWINVHGSWPLGIVYLVSRGIGRAADRHDWQRERETTLALGVGMLVGGIVNPYGPALLVFPLELLGRQDVLAHVVEWQSPEFDRLWTRAFLVMALGAMVALMRRPAWRDALPAVVFIAAALVGRRNIALASLVLLPVLARGIPAIGQLGARHTSDAIRRAVPIAASLLILLPLLALDRPHVDVGRYPEDAVTAMEDELDLAPGETRVIHQDFVGNYLGARYGGIGAAWIDDRFELHDATLVDDYITLLDGAPEWSDVLQRYEAEAILWPSDGVLVELATEVGDWQLVWNDDDWSVLCNPDRVRC